MLIDAFDDAGMTYLAMEVIAGIQAVGKVTGSEAKANEMVELLPEAVPGGSSKIRWTIQNFCTRQTFLFKEANSMLHGLESGAESPYAKFLWPFVALLQMSLLRHDSKPNGITIFRAGQIACTKVTELNASLSGGSKPLWILRGFNSATKSLAVTDELFSNDSSKNVLIKIELPKMSFDEANTGRLLLGAGAELHNVSDYASEDEVLLIDSLWLRVTEVEFDSGKNRYTVDARVDLDALRSYYAIFEAQEASAVQPAAAKKVPAKAPTASGAKVKPVSEAEQLFQQGVAIFQTPDEPRKAAELLKRAAGLGHADAMAAYGECLEFGRGVEQDEAAAASFYRRGNEAGNAWALAGLAMLRVCGEGGEPKDEPGGARMAQEAADRGSAAGIFLLGCCFYSGWGMPRDRGSRDRAIQEGGQPGLARGDGLAGPLLPNRHGCCAR
jgi:hypothetical protein